MAQATAGREAQGTPAADHAAVAWFLLAASVAAPFVAAAAASAAVPADAFASLAAYQHLSDALLLLPAASLPLSATAYHMQCFVVAIA